jgi:hypothetical protein
MDSSQPVPGSWEDRDITRFSDPPHPTLNEALQGFISEYDGPEEDVVRVDLGIQSNREVTFRLWTKESEEPTGGVTSV